MLVCVTANVFMCAMNNTMLAVLEGCVHRQMMRVHARARRLRTTHTLLLVLLVGW